MRCRKKPVIVEAILYDGYVDAGDTWLSEAFREGAVRYSDDGNLIITTLEGELTANVGDYIIRGVQGELYPCKPDIFKATYDVLPD